MSMVINHNIMAANVARTLNTHYGNLATSTQRLSSGLRINSAADDAAGLAIRELMRADIAAYNQGIRNANDAISMIQVVDGALGIIDEKLIRMKELAEQAATGTYDSTQRLMIDSEFQAMASEIQRIAVATDFNGIKLLDGKIIDINKYTENKTENIETVPEKSNKYIVFNDRIEMEDGKFDKLISGIVEEKLEIIVTSTNTEIYTIVDNELVKQNINSIETETISHRNYTAITGWGFNGPQPPLQLSDAVTEFEILDDKFFQTLESVGKRAGKDKVVNINYTLHTGNELRELIRDGYDSYIWDKPHRYDLEIDLDGDGNLDSLHHVFIRSYVDPNDVIEWYTPGSIHYSTRELPVLKKIENEEFVTFENVKPDKLSTSVKIHFGLMNDSIEDYYYIDKRDCTLKGLGLKDIRIETQDNAQEALVTINDAIVKKDQARAYYGAMQNRLENTVSNLTIQAENLQASESRISDVDVATEMTNFVRNQILTQSAVAMLSQANSMPQMAMQLIGG